MKNLILFNPYAMNKLQLINRIDKDGEWWIVRLLDNEGKIWREEFKKSHDAALIIYDHWKNGSPQPRPEQIIKEETI